MTKLRIKKKQSKVQKNVFWNGKMIWAEISKRIRKCWRGQEIFFGKNASLGIPGKRPSPCGGRWSQKTRGFSQTRSPQTCRTSETETGLFRSTWKKLEANFKPETRKHWAIHLSADSSMRDSSPKPSLDHIVCGFDPRKQLNSKRGKFPNVHGFR